MPALVVRRFAGLQSYETVWRAMQDFTARRDNTTPDELWLLEHYAVYTQGLAGRAEHVLDTAGIPLVQTDRGGQVTWHGPGQLMIYLLLDCRRLGLGARALVDVIENSLAQLLAGMGCATKTRRDAPGIYVDLPDGRVAKIASIGLRMKKQGCYHGAALNLDCALAPFAGINPCGYAGMAVTRLVDVLPVLPSREQIQQQLIEILYRALKPGQVREELVYG
ncbi:MAG TPA: lipoyl(octanoyl) transferase LipB [Pseudomonadales bacterium]|nr:lipoyl(octanoyl) transferase LipB [Pseudomonadales bacterium]